MQSVSIRIEGESEELVRRAADQCGASLTNVTYKPADNTMACWHGYGSLIVTNGTAAPAGWDKV